MTTTTTHDEARFIRRERINNILHLAALDKMHVDLWYVKSIVRSAELYAWSPADESRYQADTARINRYRQAVLSGNFAELRTTRVVEYVPLAPEHALS